MHAEDFPNQLNHIARELNASIAFEAVAGSLSGIILSAMPSGSEILVYGALSGEPCSSISPLDLIFQKKKVRGFWLSQWLESTIFYRSYQNTQRIQKMIEQDLFRTKIREQVGFSHWKEALLDYHKEMTSGKVILAPEM